MQELAQNTTPALRAHTADVLKRLNSPGTSDADVLGRQQAAVQLLEMQNLLPQLSADNQAEVNQALTAMGYEDDIRAKVSAEDFLAGTTDPSTGAAIGGGFNLGRVAGAALRSRARVYDSNVPLGARNPGDPPLPLLPYDLNEP